MKLTTSVILASATSAVAGLYTTFQNADFDDIPTSGSTLILPAQPIGNYDMLSWQNFGVTTLDAVIGLETNSGLNVAFSTALLDSTEPTLETFGDAQYYNLNSFYFGCVVQLETNALAVPVPCTLNVVGKRNNVQVIDQKFSYTPSLTSPFGLTASLMEVVLNSVDVDQVIFSPTLMLPTIQGISLAGCVFDSFLYDVTSSSSPTVRMRGTESLAGMVTRSEEGIAI